MSQSAPQRMAFFFLISAFGIIALAELLGLIYMKLVAYNQKTIQSPRKAVEETLNE